MAHEGGGRDRYEMIRSIGQGGFGEAFHVQSKITGKNFVIKRIPMGALNE